MALSIGHPCERPRRPSSETLGRSRGRLPALSRGRPARSPGFRRRPPARSGWRFPHPDAGSLSRRGHRLDALTRQQLVSGATTASRPISSYPQARSVQPPRPGHPQPSPERLSERWTRRSKPSRPDQIVALSQAPASSLGGHKRLGQLLNTLNHEGWWRVFGSLRARHFRS